MSTALSGSSPSASRARASISSAPFAGSSMRAIVWTEPDSSLRRMARSNGDRRFGLVVIAAQVRPQSRLRGFWRSLDTGQRRALLGMGAVVAVLHALGFGILFLLVAPHRYALGSGGVFTVGIGITAYTLGMRHAFDADHISAIDNTTRKLMAEGKRPLSVGFWFSLGHSTVVFALPFLLSVGIRSLAGPVGNDGSGLHRLTGFLGTVVSGSFLYAIAALNIVVLAGIIRLFREMRRGRYDEAALEAQLSRRGLLNRV